MDSNTKEIEATKEIIKGKVSQGIWYGTKWKFVGTRLGNKGNSQTSWLYVQVENIPMSLL